MADVLKPGDKAPTFTLPNQDGQLISLEQYHGKKVVLYFYPQDNTPACTKEACSLRDNHDAITQRGAVVLGISPDSTKSHTSFIGKFSLPFTLLSDPELSVIKAYGAWGTKKMYGKEYEGLMRWTFVIDEQGIIKEIIQKVKTDTHGADILNYL